MITIHNLRYEKPSTPYDFKVDRTSSLGNPFFMGNQYTRDDVCDYYEAWFYNNDKQSSRGFRKLLKAYEQFGKVRLFCWCAPLRCHAETIKRALEEYMERVQQE